MWTAVNEKQKALVDIAEENGGELMLLPKIKSNQKQKVPVDNVEEDGGELMPSPKKNRIDVNIVLFIFNH